MKHRPQWNNNKSTVQCYTQKEKGTMPCQSINGVLISPMISYNTSRQSMLGKQSPGREAKQPWPGR